MEHGTVFHNMGPRKRGADMADQTQTFDLSTRTPTTATASSTTVELAKLAIEKLGESGIGTLTKGLEATVNLAEKGVISFLLGTGVLLAFYGLTLKIQVHGKPLAQLSTGEFVAVFAMASILMVAGAGIRAWTYTSEYTLRRDQLRAKLKVLEATAGVAEKGMQASSGIAQANAEIAMANAEIAKAQTESGAKAAAAAVRAFHENSQAEQTGKDQGAI
jgi:hypothetical protein